MRLSFEPEFLSDLLRAEAAARGLSSKLRALAAMREEDGLSEPEAVADAAESMGVLGEVDAALLESVEGLSELEIETVEVMNTFGGMPTLRRGTTRLRLWLPVSPVGEQLPIVQALVEQFQVDPDRTVATVATGLGGSGGCACGEELPEDAPPGPLFAR